jgi:hypothetical protein
MIQRAGAVASHVCRPQGQPPALAHPSRTRNTLAPFTAVRNEIALLVGQELPPSTPTAPSLPPSLTRTHSLSQDLSSSSRRAPAAPTASGAWATRRNARLRSAPSLTGTKDRAPTLNGAKGRIARRTAGMGRAQSLTGAEGQAYQGTRVGTSCRIPPTPTRSLLRGGQRAGGGSCRVRSGTPRSSAQPRHRGGVWRWALRRHRRVRRCGRRGSNCRHEEGSVPAQR